MKNLRCQILDSSPSSVVLIRGWPKSCGQPLVSAKRRPELPTPLSSTSRLIGGRAAPIRRIPVQHLNRGAQHSVADRGADLPFPDVIIAGSAAVSLSRTSLISPARAAVGHFARL